MCVECVFDLIVVVKCFVFGCVYVVVLYVFGDGGVEVFDDDDEVVVVNDVFGWWWCVE